MKPKSAQHQLDGFIARYSPEVAALGKKILARFRKLVPPSIELVYDNYNFLVVGFCPSERPSEGVFSIVFYPRGVSLCFIQGAKQSDPHGLLTGSGKQIRTIKLPTAATLENPLLQQLIASAIEASPVSFTNVKRHQLVIKSISAKQRPRRISSQSTK